MNNAIAFIIIGGLLIGYAVLIGQVNDANYAIEQWQKEGQCTSTVQVVNGMFTGASKVITVETAGKNPAEVEKVLLHEYAHYLQDKNYGENMKYISINDREAFAQAYASMHKIVGAD